MIKVNYLKILQPAIAQSTGQQVIKAQEFRSGGDQEVFVQPGKFAKIRTKKGKVHFELLLDNFPLGWEYEVADDQPENN